MFINQRDGRGRKNWGILNVDYTLLLSAVTWSNKHLPNPCPTFPSMDSLINFSMWGLSISFCIMKHFCPSRGIKFSVGSLAFCGSMNLYHASSKEPPSVQCLGHRVSRGKGGRGPSQTGITLVRFVCNGARYSRGRLVQMVSTQYTLHKQK